MPCAGLAGALLVLFLLPVFFFFPGALFFFLLFVLLIVFDLDFDQRDRFFLLLYFFRSGKRLRCLFSGRFRSFCCRPDSGRIRGLTGVLCLGPTGVICFCPPAGVIRRYVVRQSGRKSGVRGREDTGAGAGRCLIVRGRIGSRRFLCPQTFSVQCR